MAKSIFIGMNEEALKTFGFKQIEQKIDGSTLWASHFGSSIVKVECGVVVSAL